VQQACLGWVCSASGDSRPNHDTASGLRSAPTVRETREPNQLIAKIIFQYRQPVVNYYEAAGRCCCRAVREQSPDLAVTQALPDLPGRGRRPAMTAEAHRKASSSPIPVLHPLGLASAAVSRRQNRCSASGRFTADQILGQENAGSDGRYQRSLSSVISDGTAERKFSLPHASIESFLCRRRCTSY
jgi:hypothetical protein